MDDRDFVPFGLPHCVALAATVAASIYMVRLNRSPSVSPQRKHRANVILGIILITAVLLDPPLTWLQYRDRPDTAWQQVRDVSLPLYLCDVVSLLLAYALIRRNQRCAEIGYLWGMAGTMQGLLTPSLYFSWDAPQYYAFFAQHGGVPVAALALAFGTKLRPQRGAFLRAVIWSWGYMIVVGGLNFLISDEANYGFLREKPGVGTMFDFMGPDYWYLLTLQAIAFTLYLALLLPFRNQMRDPANAALSNGA